MDPKKEVKVYYKEQCFATYNFSVFDNGSYDEDELYDLLRQLFGDISDKLLDTEKEQKEEKIIADIWKGNEYLKEIEIKVNEETERQYEEVIIFKEIKESKKIEERQDYFLKLMKKTLSEEQYKTWNELRSKETEEINKLWMDNCMQDIFEFRQNGCVSDRPFV